MSSQVSSVWAIVDDRAGTRSQVLGVAEALGLPFEIKRIKYNWLSRLPNSLLGKIQFSLDRTSRKAIAPPYPNIIITGGRKIVPAIRSIKKSAGNKTFVVHLMWPGSFTRDFNLIAVQEHDNVKDALYILKTKTVPHRVTPKKLELAKSQSEYLSSLRTPRIAVFIGGPNRRKDFAIDDIRALAKNISCFSQGLKGSLMVTTSRRTTKEMVQALKEELAPPHILYEYVESSQNPYFEFLAWADIIIVTGDSISMCAEACSTGKPVFIYAPPSLLPPKFQKHHEWLYSQRYARPFVKETFEKDLNSYFAACPNAASDIANKIRRMIGLETEKKTK